MASTSEQTVSLPPELWDKIFDYLGYDQQMERATVCRAWNLRVARSVSFKLSCTPTTAACQAEALEHSERKYSSFTIDGRYAVQSMHCLHELMDICQRKGFQIRKLAINFARTDMLLQLFRRYDGWIYESLQVLYVEMTVGEPLPTEDIWPNLRARALLRELKLFNVSVPLADWNPIFAALGCLTELTMIISWLTNSDFDLILESLYTWCRSLKSLTFCCCNTLSLEPLTESLPLLEELALHKVTIRVENRETYFPVLKHLTFNIARLSFPSTSIALRMPQLRSLNTKKDILRLTQLSDNTRPRELELTGLIMTEGHACFAAVEHLCLNTISPSSTESIIGELNMFPRLRSLSIYIESIECTVDVPPAIHFARLVELRINNLLLSIKFFEDVEQMQILEYLLIEECTFTTDDAFRLVTLTHVLQFRVVHVLVPIEFETFPIQSAAHLQPPIVKIDEYDVTHSCFSSTWI